MLSTSYTIVRTLKKFPLDAISTLLNTTHILKKSQLVNDLTCYLLIYNKIIYDLLISLIIRNLGYFKK